MKVIDSGFFLALLMLCSGLSVSSQKSTFDFRLVNSEFIDSTRNEVICVFAATPLGKKKDFPPVLSMKVGYQINRVGEYKYVDIQKQQDTKIQLIVYGENIAEEDLRVYDIIKEDIDISKYEDILFVVIVFRQISNEESAATGGARRN